MAKSPQLPKSRPKPQKPHNSWQLLGRGGGLLWQNRWLFCKILLIYAVLFFVLVQGFGSNGATNVQDVTVSNSVSQFGGLLSSVGAASNQNNAAYQTILLIILSLVLIWALRQTYAKKGPFKAKQAYYQSTGSLIPFAVVVFVLGLELIPFMIGAGLYATVVSNGLAVSALEQAIWLLVFVVLAGVSTWLLSGSVLALYIASLPDSRPLAALKDAKRLVKGRRWSMIRKLLFLPVALFVVALVLILPFLLWLPGLASPAFFLVGLVVLTLGHSYLYCVYRELL